MKYRIDSHYDIRCQQFRTLIARYDLHSRRSEFLKFAWQEVQEGLIIPDECWLNQDKFENEDILQAMLDLAWSRGLKPAGYTEEKPQLEAVKYHLEDMRRLVFKETK